MNVQVELILYTLEGDNRIKYVIKQWLILTLKLDFLVDVGIT